jgi:hypothetical protein
MLDHGLSDAELKSQAKELVDFTSKGLAALLAPMPLESGALS